MSGFELSILQLRSTIYKNTTICKLKHYGTTNFSIMAMPKESHFTIFAIQNFVQNTKKHTRTPFILL